MDDILIFSETMAEHRQYVKKVLTKLSEAGLQLNIDKCEFHVSEVKYLGLIITPGGIKMDPAKVAAIVAWLAPRNVRKVQSFLKFANFYRRFITGFSLIAAPFTALTRKNKKFAWTAMAQKAFEDLKEAFTTTPIL